MIPNENGDEYIEYTGDTWPGDEYVYKEAKCIDESGALIKEEVVTFENDTAILTADKTIYCTLFFDKKPHLRLLCENYNNMQSCIAAEKENIGSVPTLSSVLVGDMYRYQGVSEQYAKDEVNNPENLPVVNNNYICFGTDDKEACLSDPDKYMYRIIGITEDGKMKLIKNTFLRENGEIVNSKWSNVAEISQPYTGNTEGTCDGDRCEWPNSILYRRLNGIATNDDGTNIFINSSEYTYLNSKSSDNKWYNSIETRNWLYGDIADDYRDIDVDIVYEIETGKREAKPILPEVGCNLITPPPSPGSVDVCSQHYENTAVWSNYVPAKIGLIYIHDYMYSISSSPSSNYVEKLISWLPSNEKVYYNHYSEATIVRSMFGICDQYNPNPFNICVGNFHITPSLYVPIDLLTSENFVRPTFYLNSSVKISSGSGSESDPFVLTV